MNKNNTEILGKQITVNEMCDYLKKEHTLTLQAAELYGEKWVMLRAEVAELRRMVLTLCEELKKEKEEYTRCLNSFGLIIKSGQSWNSSDNIKHNKGKKTL